MHALRRIVLAPVALAIALALAASGLSWPSDIGAPTRPAIDQPAVSLHPSGSGAVAGATFTPNAATRGMTAGAPIKRVKPTATPATSAIVAGSVNRASVVMSATYDVALNLNFGTRVITVDTILAAKNTSGGPVDRLELNTVAARLGGLRILNVSVDAGPATATVNDQTIVIPLGGTLPQGATVKARVIYRATLRSDLAGSNWLFTRVNGIANLYRWLPWISRATAFDRPNHGDPFVTAVSPRVTVKVMTDRPLVVATTGRRIAASGLTQTFQAENVRDFTVTAAPDFRTGSRVVGKTTVRVWYRPGFPATAALDAAAKALERMNGLAGTYPYGHYNVVQSAGGYAMESPGLIWVPTGVASSNLRYLVYHETAHQWFYGVVGGDQAREPFTDEAAADFLARYALGTKRASRCSTARLDLTIYQYSSGCYYEIVYIQGGNFIDDLRSRMGSTDFWRGLRAWVTQNRFAIAPTKSLLETLDAHTPLDLVPRYKTRFPRLY
ncbi:MAG TPA: hypothetical protein VM344_03570 [Vitreimonas sp.]|nr:hypothetical protein [Vitreimonas sp.]